MRLTEKIDKIVDVVKTSEYAKTRKNVKEALKVAKEIAKKCVLYFDNAGQIYVCGYENEKEVEEGIHAVIDFVKEVRTAVMVTDDSTVRRRRVSPDKLEIPAKILYHILKGAFKVIPAANDELWVELDKIKNAGIYLSITFITD